MKYNIPLGAYRHFKGNVYELIAIANNSENPEELFAVYRSRLNPEQCWVRPLAMFCEIVAFEGKSVPRFEYIEK